MLNWIIFAPIIIVSITIIVFGVYLIIDSAWDWGVLFVSTGIFLIVLSIVILFFEPNDIFEDNKTVSEISVVQNEVGEAKKSKDRENRLVVFTQELIGEPVEYMYYESESLLDVLRAGDNIYRLKYSNELNKIECVIHGDRIIYSSFP